MIALETRIVGDLGITYGSFGLAITGLSLVSAVMQLPSGVLGDRFGERSVILGAVILTGGATVLVAFVPSYTVFLLLVFVVGIGSGSYYTPATSLLDRLYNRTGQAIGTFRIGGQVAGVLAPIIAGLIAVHFGWRGAILASGLLLVPIAIGLVVFMRPSEPLNPATTFQERLSMETLIGAVSRRDVATTTVLASLIQFVDVASFTFLPAILHEYHDLPLLVATTLYGGYFALVAIVQPLTGRVSDRFGRDRAIAVTLFAGITGYGLLLFTISFAGVVLGVGLAGVSMTWAAPVQAKFVGRFDTNEQGTGFGLVRTVYLLFGALGGAVIGEVATQFGWPVAIGVMVSILCSSLGILFLSAFIRGYGFR